MKLTKLIILLGVTIFMSCRQELPEEVQLAYDNLPEELDFDLHVRPILSDKCFLCHGPDQAKQQAGLRLDFAEFAYQKLPETGRTAIVPGNLRKSEVFHRIISDDHDYLMPEPESNLDLSPQEKAVLIRWIEEGAKYKPHWAFQKPEEPALPEFENEEWIINSIDRFVLKRLKEKGMMPSPEADKATLLRRVSFDLTGLPPTKAEIDHFLDDDSPDAYEKVVDRLLASPHYGEKMARDWIDLARFADTHGYSLDRYRDMSPWRDWVIKAFNENMSYDQFVTWQLAGDLLPNPSRDQIIATAFNRLHQQNMEGGIVPEEFRVEYVLDRTNTFGKAFMALSLECARCHDHKYDPVSQKEYYQLSGFFNNVNEAGQISFNDAMPVPTILMTTEEQDSVIDYLKSQIRISEEKLNELNSEPTEKESFEGWMSQRSYQRLATMKYPRDLEAHFTFDNSRLENSANPSQKGEMKSFGSDKEESVLVEAKNGKGLKLDGDAWFDAGKVGVFRRSNPFSVGIWVKIPSQIENGVIFHKGSGAALYNFRGFHLALKNNRLEVLMAHTTPDNAIIEYGPDLPRDQWIHVMMTYDGSSSASGLKAFLNAEEIETTVEVDNLYKDIFFVDNPDEKDREPGIQVGARWRGKGIGNAVVDDLMSFKSALSPLEIRLITDAESLSGMLNKSPSEFNEDELSLLKDYFIKNSRNYKIASKSLEKLRTVLADSVENIPEVMVMKEMKAPRKTYVLNRGLYHSPSEQVFPNTPQTILPMPDDLPNNRLGLAQWLLDPDHPLTARVAVNRYWQNYFGQGLVKTTEDFGNQGSRPSHPKLLDWLAIDFMESGWDIKALQKKIVMSATYRQDSKASEEWRGKDPENILLARGPAVRLSGEMLRDNALAASGLLNPQIGGKSIKPYQPDGLWRVNGGKYEQDTGDSLYRRSLYIFWKRSVPHPTLSTFDAPERSECTVRRQKTNTPLQALVLLNDPTYNECAKVMGADISKNEDPASGLKEAFVNLTGRYPKPQEMDILLELRERQLKRFREDPEKVKGWIGSGAYELERKFSKQEVAANAVTVSTIMNADATITKR
ncbi:MAG: DUF1553 domain-containing protein [Cyclobacteriaceae bacterium]